MSVPFIFIGDKTDHGGEVLEGCAIWTWEGKAVARVGDAVSCPKHGKNHIITGDSRMLIPGGIVARHGDKTACGATLISSQVVMTIYGQSAIADSTSSPYAAATASVQPSAATMTPARAGPFANADNAADGEILEQYFTITDEQGNATEGYSYDLFVDGVLHTRNASLQEGKTVSIPGDTALTLTLWSTQDAASNK